MFKYDDMPVCTDIEISKDFISDHQSNMKHYEKNDQPPPGGGEVDVPALIPQRTGSFTLQKRANI